MREGRHQLGALGLAIICLAGPATAAEIGDAERGAELFRQCQSCHAIGPEAENQVGPHLNEVFGRKAGAVAGFRYSRAMARASADGLVWTVDKLDLYLENPKNLVTGTRMNFRGIADPRERADLMAFLRAYSVSPRDIPESEPTAAPRDPDVDSAILAIDGDPAYGEYLSGECVTCHQVTGGDDGIPSITGWPREDFVVALHAYKNKDRRHPVMQMISGKLSDEEIAALAAFFQALE